MHSCFLSIALLIVISAVFFSCGMSNKMASEMTPMIVVDGGAGLYDGNDLIGNLPAGTEVCLIEKKGKWCLVEVQVDGYNMKVKGLISPESLAQRQKMPVFRLLRQLLARSMNQNARKYGVTSSQKQGLMLLLWIVNTFGLELLLD